MEIPGIIPPTYYFPFFPELETLKSVSEASEAAGINSEVCQQFRLLRNFIFFFSFEIFRFFSEFRIFSFPLLPEGEMKIHLQTKRNLKR